jgi:hypothetical protein
VCRVERDKPAQRGSSPTAEARIQRSDGAQGRRRRCSLMPLGGLGTSSEQAVVPGPLGVRRNAVCARRQALPAGTIVQFGAPGGDPQVSPPVSDAQLAEINVRGPAAVIGQQGVRRAAVAVADDQPVGRRNAGEQFQRPVSAERLAGARPGGRIEAAAADLAAEAGEAVLCRP